MKSSATVVKTLLMVIILFSLSVLAFAWSGLYPAAAGSGHTAPVAWLLETVRKRSVAVRAADLVVPDDLDAPERIAAGAGHYDAMCAGCHGKPGEEPASAFEPAPPALYRHRVDEAKAFWTIKHGLKMTAMPSHLDHSDEENWDTVAFVRSLPDMDTDRYENLTADATHDHGNGANHNHGGGSDDHSGETANEDGHHSDQDIDAQAHTHSITTDSPGETVEAFRHALVEGRRDAALEYLHPKATIIEGGQVQSVEEYADGHLGSDMEFLAKIDIEQLTLSVQSGTGQATVTSQSRLRGQINDQPLDLLSTEYATLIETEEGWRISQIAWSSEPYTGDNGTKTGRGPGEDSHQHTTGDEDHDH